MLSVRFIERTNFPQWKYKSVEKEPLDPDLAAWGSLSSEDVSEGGGESHRTRSKKHTHKKIKRSAKVAAAAAAAKHLSVPIPALAEQPPPCCFICSSAEPLETGGAPLDRGLQLPLCGCNCGAGHTHIECLRKVAQTNEKVWRRCLSCSEHWSDATVRVELARSWCNQTAFKGWKDPERIQSANHLTLALRLNSKLKEADRTGREVLAATRKIYGNEADITVSAMARLSMVLVDQGLTAAALPLQLEALGASKRRARKQRHAQVGQVHAHAFASVSTFPLIKLDITTAENYDVKKRGASLKSKLCIYIPAIDESLSLRVLAGNSLPGRQKASPKGVRAGSTSPKRRGNPRAPPKNAVGAVGIWQGVGERTAVGERPQCDMVVGGTQL